MRRIWVIASTDRTRSLADGLVLFRVVSSTQFGNAYVTSQPSTLITNGAARPRSFRNSSAASRTLKDAVEPERGDLASG